MQIDPTQSRPGILGGFSLSNIQGPSLVAGLIVLGAIALLFGHFWMFRDVAQF